MLLDFHSKHTKSKLENYAHQKNGGTIHKTGFQAQTNTTEAIFKENKNANRTVKKQS